MGIFEIKEDAKFMMKVRDETEIIRISKEYHSLTDKKKLELFTIMEDWILTEKNKLSPENIEQQVQD
jgi:hypothetical protein